MLAQAGDFLPTDLGGWLVVVGMACAMAAGAWASVNRIVRAINNIQTIPVHSEEIAELKGKAEDIDDGQLAVLAELRDIKGGMVTAEAMERHTEQDAEQFGLLDDRLASIDGRLGRVEEHVAIETPEP